jgi:hypothetical protein
VAETGQPYAFTGDDPLNATDPLGFAPVWVKGGKYYSHEVPGSHRLPTEGERYYIPQKMKGNPKVTFDKDNDPVDNKQNVWEWDGSTRAHAGPHYDVQHPLTEEHTNVAQDGKVIGQDNFPNNANLGNPSDSSSSSGDGDGGGADVGGDGGGFDVGAGVPLVLPLTYGQIDHLLCQLAPCPRNG